jgi:hypothetical protein
MIHRRWAAIGRKVPWPLFTKFLAKLRQVSIGTYLLQLADDVVETVLVLVLFLPSSGGLLPGGLGQVVLPSDPFPLPFVRL